MEEMFTPDDLSAILKVPKSWIYDRTRKNGPERLPFFKLGRYVRFWRSEVDEFLTKKAQKMRLPD
jgi:excisionase family DNA binding protein